MRSKRGKRGQSETSYDHERDALGDGHDSTSFVLFIVLVRKYSCLLTISKEDRRLYYNIHSRYQSEMFCTLLP
jgi:hypothetical protein